MTKSSEVLRLAAEYAITGDENMQANPVHIACLELAPFIRFNLPALLKRCGYMQAKFGEETCMVLCLAAAITEDAGD